VNSVWLRGDDVAGYFNADCLPGWILARLSSGARNAGSGYVVDLWHKHICSTTGSSYFNHFRNRISLRAVVGADGWIREALTLCQAAGSLRGILCEAWEPGAEAVRRGR
jgi:hypothetical protein